MRWNLGGIPTALAESTIYLDLEYDFSGFHQNPKRLHEADCTAWPLTAVGSYANVAVINSAITAAALETAAVRLSGSRAAHLRVCCDIQTSKWPKR